MAQLADRINAALLAAPDGVTAGELARALGEPQPRVTAVLARLMDAGKVARTDGRPPQWMAVVALDRAGRRLARRGGRRLAGSQWFPVQETFGAGVASSEKVIEIQE